MTPTGPLFFCKLLQNGASHETKIGCIRLVWAGAKKYKFSFLLCAGPLSFGDPNCLKNIHKEEGEPR